MAPSIFGQIFTLATSALNRGNKRNNAVIVPRSRQWAGDLPSDLPLIRFYDYYHGWSDVKNGLNSVHRRLVGTGIEIQTEDPVFTELLEKWCEITNFKSKLKEFLLDTLITGNGFFELQFTPQGQLGNVEHIPSYTMWRIFRDQHANVLEYVQLVEGLHHSLAPKYIVHMAINNPEKDGFGKSEIYSIAVPQKVSGKVDENGNAINPDRYMPSILDSVAKKRFAHIETLLKHAKSQIFVSVQEKDRERQLQIEKDINNESSDKWIHVTNGDVKAAEASINPNVKFSEWEDDLKTQVDNATGFPSKVMSDAGTMGFASSQTPVQELQHRIADMQSDANELCVDRIFKLLAEQWGFDFSETKPKIVFKQFIEKVLFDQFIKIPQEYLSPEEARENLKTFGVATDDELFEKWQEEKKKEQETLMQQQGSSDSQQPDMDSQAPKPPAGNGSIKEFEEEIAAIARKQVKESLSRFTNPDEAVPFDLDEPLITDPIIAARIEEIKRQKKKSDANEAVKVTYAGFSTLHECINENLQEENPENYCIMHREIQTLSDDSDTSQKPATSTKKY